MKRATVELTELELKVIVAALKYTKAYKGAEIYETVLNRLVELLKKGTPRYYVVQGTVNDGICVSTETVLVKAINNKQAVEVAARLLVSEAGVTFQPTYVGEARANYEICGVLRL